MNNKTRLELLKQAKSSGYTGSYIDLFQSHNSSVDNHTEANSKKEIQRGLEGAPYGASAKLNFDTFEAHSLEGRQDHPVKVTADGNYQGILFPGEEKFIVDTSMEIEETPMLTYGGVAIKQEEVKSQLDNLIPPMVEGRSLKEYQKGGTLPKYVSGGNIKPLDQDGNERQMPDPNTKRTMSNEESAQAAIDSANAVSTFDWFKSLGTQTTDGVINVFENLKKKVTGESHSVPNQGAIQTTDDGSKMIFKDDAWIPYLEQKKGNVETYQLNLKGKKGKSSASKDYVPEGTEKNGKYLHYTEEGPKWLDDPVGLTFEQEASEGTVNPFASGYEYINGQGWTYKGGVPAAPSDKKEKKTSTIHNNNLGLTNRGELSDWYTSNMDKPNFGYTNFEDFKADWPTAQLDGGYAITGEGGPEYSMDQERKPEKLIKLPSRSIEQIPTPEMGGPKRLPPFELMKNNSSHFTIQRQGLHSGTYPKGEDGLALRVLKDQAGRVVWKGSQKEYEKNYGDFLEKGDTEYGERKKHRLYLKKYQGDEGSGIVDPDYKFTRGDYQVNDTDISEIDFDLLYNAVESHEHRGAIDTEGYNSFIRTKAKGSNSSAYGPVQLTGDLLSNITTPGVRRFYDVENMNTEYHKKLVSQSKLFLKYGGGDYMKYYDKETGQYDGLDKEDILNTYEYGGEGFLGDTDEDRENYRTLGIEMLKGGYRKEIEEHKASDNTHLYNMIKNYGTGTDAYAKAVEKNIMR